MAMKASGGAGVNWLFLREGHLGQFWESRVKDLAGKKKGRRPLWGGQQMFKGKSKKMLFPTKI